MSGNMHIIARTLMMSHIYTVIVNVITVLSGEYSPESTLRRVRSQVS